MRDSLTTASIRLSRKPSPQFPNPQILESAFKPIAFYHQNEVTHIIAPIIETVSDLMPNLVIALLQT